MVSTDYLGLKRIKETHQSRFWPVGLCPTYAELPWKAKEGDCHTTPSRPWPSSPRAPVGTRVVPLWLVALFYTIVSTCRLILQRLIWKRKFECQSHLVVRSPERGLQQRVQKTRELTLRLWREKFKEFGEKPGRIGMIWWPVEGSVCVLVICCLWLWIVVVDCGL